MNLYELLEEGNTISVIAEELDVTFSDAKESVIRLVEEGAVKIIDWELSEERTNYIPVYGFGTYNKKMPKAPSTIPQRHWFDKIWFGERGLASDEIKLA
jgi:predicted transcriptional regulator